MTEKDIVREIMKNKGISQKELAKLLGYNTQSGVAERLAGKSMRVDTFVSFLEVLGYKLVVVSNSPNKDKSKWVVRDNVEEEASE